MSEPQYRVILLHPKGMDEEMVNNYAMRVSEVIEGIMAMRGIERRYYVTPASNDWMVYGHIGYEKWCNSLYNRYDMAITITQTFGKATCRILSSFIQKGKQIRFFNNTGLPHIKDIVTIDDTNWQSGWSCRLK